MKAISKLIIFGLTLFPLTASTFAQEPSSHERFEAATAAVKKAESALAQAKSAEANAIALNDKEALSISQQAVAIAEKSLTRAHKAQGALFIKTMNAQAKQLDWSPDEQARLNTALNK